MNTTTARPHAPGHVTHVGGGATEAGARDARDDDGAPTEQVAAVGVDRAGALIQAYRVIAACPGRDLRRVVGRVDLRGGASTLSMVPRSA